MRLDDAAHVLGREALVDMLGREHDLGDADRLAVDILHRDLALGVGTELAGLAGLLLAGGGQVLEDLVRVVDRRRHQLRRLAAGIAEHDALVAGAFVLIAGRVDALRDVGGLGVQQDLDLGVLPVKAILLVADVLDRGTGDGLDPLGIDRRAADLAGNDDAVRGRERLAGHANGVGVDAFLGAFAEEQVDHFV